MPFHHSGIAFSASLSHSAQRYCYARASAVDELLASPGSLELLLQELMGEPPQPSSVVEQLAQLKRRAIHLSVTRTAFHGMSLEEIVVLCAYSSPHFHGSAFRRQLLAEPSPADQWEQCKAWLQQRASHIRSAEEVGARRWPLVGSSAPPGDGGAPFIVAVAPITHSAFLDRELPGLGHASGFAHEHYVACTPATALDYVRRAAVVGNTTRWDPFALDRQLRSLGLGLLLVEGGGVSVYLPARYHPSPLPPVSVPAPAGSSRL